MYLYVHFADQLRIIMALTALLVALHGMLREKTKTKKVCVYSHRHTLWV